MTKLVFLDMEMTGLNPETDCILEVAVAVVEATPEGLGKALQALRAVPAIPDVVDAGAFWYRGVVNQPESVLAEMNSWCVKHHSASGLIDMVRRSPLSLFSVEKVLLHFLYEMSDFEAGTAVLAGNTIHFDRAFIRRWMPDLDAFLHYRLFDISTLRQFILTLGAAPSNRPSGGAFWEAHAYATRKQSGPDDDAHRAFPDVIASIEELLMYMRGLA